MNTEDEQQGSDMEIERKDFGKAASRYLDRKHCESDARWCEARINVKMGAWLCWQLVRARTQRPHRQLEIRVRAKPGRP